MDRMINSAPNYSGLSAYERSEDVVIKMQTCEYCEGHGIIYYCVECGEDANICECGVSRILSHEGCTHCDGEGEVEI